jgi:MFS family permease
LIARPNWHAGYLGGHLSDHLGRRPLIVAAGAGQTALVLALLPVGGSATAGLAVLGRVEPEAASATA